MSGRDAAQRHAMAFDDNDAMKRVAKVLPLREQVAHDLAYWLSQPMAERIAAVEVLRRQSLDLANPLDAQPRLQRVCRIARRQRR